MADANPSSHSPRTPHFVRHPNPAAHARETLRFLGFEEVVPGHFVRVDGPHGRVDDPTDARFLTSVSLSKVAHDPAALERIVQRFSRIHGRLER